jgi:DNA-binding transcriptional MerR regulator
MAISGAMRIDEAARTAGVTARNIRAYQSLGLVSPPRLAGRVGFYDAGHLRRLQAIGRLQTRGFSLAGIKELFDAYDRGEALGTVLGLQPAEALDSGLDARVPSPLTFALVPGPWIHQLLPPTSRAGASN